MDLCLGHKNVVVLVPLYPINVELVSCFISHSHLATSVKSPLADTQIIRKAATSDKKMNYRCLTKINSRYFELSLVNKENN